MTPNDQKKTGSAPATPQADTWTFRLERLAGKTGGTVAVRPAPQESRSVLPPAAGSIPELKARRFEGRIPPGRALTSFSSIIHGARLGYDEPDYDLDEIDESPTVVTAPAAPVGPYALPSGPVFGKIAHRIFEICDFTDPVSVRESVAAAVRENDILRRWGKELEGLVQNTIRTSLDGKDLRLDALPRSERLDELEFHFPFSPEAAARLRDALPESQSDAALRPRQIGRLSLSPGGGFVKGFIDMVFRHEGRFYILDYKTNLLGFNRDAFAREALPEVMRSDMYTLQCLIYLVALHRYLKHRIPDYDYDRDIGGAYYLFLRGMSPDDGPAYGVFHDRPERRFLESLSTCFGDNDLE